MTSQRTGTVLVANLTVCAVAMVPGITGTRYYWYRCRYRNDFFLSMYVSKHTFVLWAVATVPGITGNGTGTGTVLVTIFCIKTLRL
jgi:hypothetical protein